ncbi:hypothetical protein [Streptomyces mirabilis]|uniref:MalT-like TPR region domain-containing protein n=1 Tax=Streptomyces mirabilis TaxID=68239 RepID=A0A1I2WGS3_9ACTN|nr:hypothetical protein [Streptomyces mirabilis]SFH00525.1 hypothetical protein SAMN02787118_13737 [Streptomyces mirabilis]
MTGMDAPAKDDPGLTGLGTEPASDLETLLGAATRALVVEGDLQTGRRRFDAAYRIAESTGDARAMAVAALGFGGLWVHEHRTVAGSALLRSRLRHALSLLAPDSSLALRLRVRLVGETDYRAGEHAAILALLDEVRPTADPVARAEALSLAHHCVLGPDHGASRRKLSVDLVAESFRTARHSDLLMGLLWQTVDLFLDGDPHAERRLAELRDLLAEQDHLAVGFVVSAIEVMLAIRAGRLDQAETLTRACAERGAVAGDVDATVWLEGQLLTIRWYQGRVEELLPLLGDLVHSPKLSPVDNHGLAALAVAGDRRKAVGALATLCGRDLADLPRSSSWLVTMNGIVQAAHLLDDVETSARAYELLSPFGHLPMMGSLAVACFGSVQHALGVASLTTGDLDRAVEHFHAAVQQNLALAHWPAVMASRQMLAQALARRARPDDDAAARRERAAAAEEAAALRGAGRPGDPEEKPPETEATCARQGRKWRIGLGRRSTLVEHSIGMFHLAVLIANPGQEIRAVDLVAGLTALDGAVGRSALSEQPTLDRVAVHEYRHRLTGLRAEIADLESRDEHEDAAGARREHDWLVTQLAGAAGLGGRLRRFAEGDERARIAVGKAIRRALQRITDADPLIGEHLRHTVHTGLRCSYWPT